MPIPLTKAQIVKKFKNAKLRTGTVIYTDSKIGNGLQTGHNVVIREQNKIGENVLIGVSSYLGPNNIIGNNVRIHTNCFLENVTLENDVIIAPHVVFTNDKYPPCKKCVESGGVIVGSKTVIGANSTILPGITIGKNCLIGAGTVITKDVSDNSIVIGNPGKVIKVNTKHIHK